jgi:hypothetical protein
VAIDYSSPGFAFPKARNKALDKQDKQAALEALDKKENAKAKKRAKGRCEVMEQRPNAWSHFPGKSFSLARCGNKDTETHHLLGGIGRRNKGKSILAEYKLRVCKDCHAAITANILKPTTAEHDASTVRYWRSK